MTTRPLLPQSYDTQPKKPGKINRKEALLATVAIWFPQTIYEAFAYIAPTIVPVLGMLGIVYLALFVLNGMVVAVLMFIAGRVLLARKDCEFVAESGSEKVVIRTTLKRSVNSSLHLLKRIVLIALPMSIIAFVLIDLGVFDALPRYLGWMPLPPEALAVIPLELANPMAAVSRPWYGANAFADNALASNYATLTLPSKQGNALLRERTGRSQQF